MITFFKVLALAFFIFTGSLTAFLGFRELKPSGTKLTVFQKMRKAFKVSLMFNVCIFSFLAVLPVSSWSDITLRIDVIALSSFLVLIFIPSLVVITVGIFVQLTYLEFLIHTGKKK